MAAAPHQKVDNPARGKKGGKRGAVKNEGKTRKNERLK